MYLSLKLKTTLFFLTLIFLLTPFFVNAQDEKVVNKVNLYFFYSQTCPHCQAEAFFLSHLKQEYKDKIQIYAFEVTENKGNVKLFQKFGQVYQADISGVPMTFIGERYVSGYYNDEYTGAEIKNLVEQCLSLECPDPGYKILFPDEECDNKNQESQPCPQKTQTKIIKLPLLGEVNLKSLSLPLLTVVLGTLDGFNPCSMWALIMLIALLINAGSKRKLWLVGMVFILTSSLSYFLFLTAWLNIFLLVGYLTIIRVIVGILAIAVGVYFLVNYFKKTKQEAVTCDIASSQGKNKFIRRLERVLSQEKILTIIIGVILIAFSVNVIEFMCSAGVPAIYTQILSQNNLPKISSYWYLVVYVFFYMLDDIIVLLIAAFTWRLFAGTNRATKLSHLIGGVLILILGILMIVKPGWLMF